MLSQPVRAVVTKSYSKYAIAKTLAGDDDVVIYQTALEYPPHLSKSCSLRSPLFNIIPPATLVEVDLTIDDKTGLNFKKHARYKATEVRILTQPKMFETKGTILKNRLNVHVIEPLSVLLPDCVLKDYNKRLRNGQKPLQYGDNVNVMFVNCECDGYKRVATSISRSGVNDSHDSVSQSGSSYAESVGSILHDRTIPDDPENNRETVSSHSFALSGHMQPAAPFAPDLRLAATRPWAAHGVPLNRPPDPTRVSGPGVSHLAASRPPRSAADSDPLRLQGEVPASISHLRTPPVFGAPPGLALRRVTAIPSSLPMACPPSGTLLRSEPPAEVSRFPPANSLGMPTKGNMQPTGSLQPPSAMQSTDAALSSQFSVEKLPATTDPDQTTLVYSKEELMKLSPTNSRNVSLSIRGNKVLTYKNPETKFEAYPDDIVNPPCSSHQPDLSVFCEKKTPARNSEASAFERAMEGCKLRMSYETDSEDESPMCSKEKAKSNNREFKTPTARDNHNRLKDRSNSSLRGFDILPSQVFGAAAVELPVGHSHFNASGGAFKYSNAAMGSKPLTEFKSGTVIGANSSKPRSLLETVVAPPPGLVACGIRTPLPGFRGHQPLSPRHLLPNDYSKDFQKYLGDYLSSGFVKAQVLSTEAATRDAVIQSERSDQDHSFHSAKDFPTPYPGTPFSDNLSAAEQNDQHRRPLDLGGDINQNALFVPSQSVPTGTNSVQIFDPLGNPAGDCVPDVASFAGFTHHSHSAGQRWSMMTSRSAAELVSPSGLPCQPGHKLTRASAAAAPSGMPQSPVGQSWATGQLLSSPTLHSPVGAVSAANTISLLSSTSPRLSPSVSERDLSPLIRRRPSPIHLPLNRNPRAVKPAVHKGGAWDVHRAVDKTLARANDLGESKAVPTAKMAFSFRPRRQSRH